MLPDFDTDRRVQDMYHRLRQDVCFQAIYHEYAFGDMKLGEFSSLVRDMALDAGADDELAGLVADEASIPF